MLIYLYTVSHYDRETYRNGGHGTSSTWSQSTAKKLMEVRFLLVPPHHSYEKPFIFQPAAKCTHPHSQIHFTSQQWAAAQI